MEADFGALKREIIVVDNNSDDSVGEILAWQFPEVVFIQNARNSGMGGGNNVGIRRAQGKYVIIMNPDTIAFSDTFTKLFEYMEAHPEAGIVGPRQFNPDQSVQDSRYRWHTLATPFVRRTFVGRSNSGRRAVERFMLHDISKDKTIEPDWLLGSCLCIRKKALDQVGGFDERFFLYFEDTDLCRRFWTAGWCVVYYPEARIIHNHNRESARQSWYTFFLSKASRRHIRSWFSYLWKWFGKKAPHQL